MMTPALGYSFIIRSNCPHLAGWSVLQVSTVPYGKFQFIVIKMLSVLSFLESKVITKGLQREWLRANTFCKWRQECQASYKELRLFSKSSSSTSYKHRVSFRFFLFVSSNIRVLTQALYHLKPHLFCISLFFK
jgi:hypothetical protein